jgi:3',5'-cyclic AMP phosphodiesterase CpdA
MFVLAHLSDPHLGPLPTPNPLELLSKRGLGFLNWLRKRRAIHQPAVLAGLVADMTVQAPDHIAVTGDLVNLSLTNEFAPARAWLDGLGAPADVTLVPGNHDAYVRATAGHALRDWGDFMRGDAGENFPFVRRRGPVAIVGVSSSLPTLPLAATGRIGIDQLARLPAVLDHLGQEGLFRVLMIHHPPVQNAHYFRRLVDAQALRDILQKHGAELVLHGHHHQASLVWLSGPGFLIPCVGVPSASVAPDHEDDPAAYNLYEISGKPGDWRCTAIARGLSRGGDSIAELSRIELAS